ncbi:Pepd [Symbiodinium sp. CCMP2592]|nr:Pepd [Symbiodinium sp. CCMP2592]
MSFSASAVAGLRELRFHSLWVLMQSRYVHWCISALASHAVACNWCYLRTCLVDFAPDFCASSCGSLQFQDDVDWQRSQDMLEVVVRIWTQINPDSQEFQQVQALLLEAIEMGRQSCEAAALTAQLLVMGFQQPAALEVQKLLLPQGGESAAHDPMWASSWFLSLPDPAILALTGWQGFFDALNASLAETLLLAPPCSLEALGGVPAALDLLQLAASMDLGPMAPPWRQAVAFRVLKDRLRSAFEILRVERETLRHGQEGHECMSTVASIVAEVSSRVASKFRDVRWISTLSRWPELPSPPRQEPGESMRAAVCVAGQPRAMSGELLEPMARQLFKSLCPVAAGTGTSTSAPLLLLFSLASQPHLGVEAGHAASASLQSQLSKVLRSTSCPQLGPLPAVLGRVDVVDDGSYEDVEEVVNAYSEEAWWHGEKNGRLKWARQLLGISRCQIALQEEEETVGQVDWVVFLRPDLLHIVPLPDLSHLRKGHVAVFPDGGQKLSLQAGYLEGLDRALILSRSVAEAFFVLPLQSLRNASFLKRHLSCLSCSGWRSPGVKLSPEKHLANVLWQWAEDHGSKELELTVDENWIQPLVLSERGCINFRPCTDQSCVPAEPQQKQAPTHGPRLPRWARSLALRRTCWPLDAELEAGAEAWVNAAPSDTVEAFLESPAAILVPRLPEQENCGCLMLN